jgi:hypothetical protein
MRLGDFRDGIGRNRGIDEFCKENSVKLLEWLDIRSILRGSRLLHFQTPNHVTTIDPGFNNGFSSPLTMIL